MPQSRPHDRDETAYLTRPTASEPAGLGRRSAFLHALDLGRALAALEAAERDAQPPPLPAAAAARCAPSSATRSRIARQ